MIFNIQNIYKKYKNNLVLKGFSYSFSQGVYLLTGINGIGKSTLLKIISRIIKPSNSNYKIDNLKVAYLCEKMELVNKKPSVFLSEICKINKTSFNIQEDLSKWEIPDKKIYNLSKGNKQKTSLLLMQYSNADIYLFDEPTDSLDKKGIEFFSLLIKELEEKEKIIIISTHEPSYFKNIKYKEIRLCLE